MALYVRIVKIFYFLDNLPSLTNTAGKKHRYCSGHNLGKDKLKSCDL